MSAAPILPEQLVEKFLRSIKNQFYKGHEKLFFQERRLLLMAITHPATYLQTRGVGLTTARYQSVLTEIILTINAHGKLAEVRSPGRYLLHAVQTHMQHHGEDYYEAGKRMRNAIEDALAGLKPRVKVGAIQSDDNPVPVLAETARILATSKGGRKPSAKKTAAPILQSDFFHDAKPLHSPGKTRA